MASYLDELLKQFDSSGGDVDTTVYAPPVQPSPLMPRGPVMSPGTGRANQNFLDSLLNRQEQDPVAMYGAANAASAPFQSPTDTGGGLVPMRLPELKSNEGARGMANSLLQRSGDDLPKPEDSLDNMPVQDVVRNDIAEVPELMRKEAVVEQAKQVPEAPVDPLIEAQSRSNNLAGLMMMMKGAERAGAGFAHTKSDAGYADEMKGLINRPVEDVMLQKKAASDDQDLDTKKFNYAFAKDKDDPNSPSSHFYRDTLKELSGQSGINLKIPDNMSAAEMEKVYPSIINIVNAKEARESRGIAAKEKSTEKQTVANQKRLSLFQEAMDPSKARAGVLSTVEKRINSADAIEGLFSQFPDYNIPPAQTVELATSVAGLVSGGNPQSQQQINELVPHSMVGNFEKIAGWITNDPRGLKQQKFMHMLHDTAKREKVIAEAQRMNYYQQRMTGYGDVRKNMPDDYANVIRGSRMNPDDFDEKGLYVPAKDEKGNLRNNVAMISDKPTGTSTLNDSQEKGVAAFMKANPTLTNKNEAIAILKKAGKL